MMLYFKLLNRFLDFALRAPLEMTVVSARRAPLEMTLRSAASIKLSGYLSSNRFLPSLISTKRSASRNLFRAGQLQHREQRFFPNFAPAIGCEAEAG